MIHKCSKCGALELDGIEFDYWETPNGKVYCAYCFEELTGQSLTGTDYGPLPVPTPKQQEENDVSTPD